MAKAAHRPRRHAGPGGIVTLALAGIRHRPAVDIRRQGRSGRARSRACSGACAERVPAYASGRPDATSALKDVERAASALVDRVFAR